MLTVSELLAEGFSLPMIMDFLIAIYPKQAATFETIRANLQAGMPFYRTTASMKLPQTVQYQLKVAETCGNFSQGLAHVAHYLQTNATHKRTLRQTLTYPLGLCVLVIGLLFGLRQFLLPQLQRMVAKQTVPFFLGGLFWSLENLPLLLLGLASVY